MPATNGIAYHGVFDTLCVVHNRIPLAFGHLQHLKFTVHTSINIEHKISGLYLGMLHTLILLINATAKPTVVYIEPQRPLLF